MKNLERINDNQLLRIESRKLDSDHRKLIY